MIPVLSRDQMRAFDADAIGTAKVPSLVLMESAGRGAADVLERELFGGRAAGKHVIVVCGTGNNGGDGFVVARHLLVRRARVETWLAGDPAKMTADCRANHDAFVGLGGAVFSIGSQRPDLATSLSHADVVIDAIFGTGLDRTVGNPLADVLATIDSAPCAKVALDVPSGMNADTGAAMGCAVTADLTIAFAFPKLGHLTSAGAMLSGHVHVVDIGVPRSAHGSPAAELVEMSDVRERLAPRTLDAHKYRAGHVAVIAGSHGKIGAALLSATGALRGGAGAATIATWPDAARALDQRVLEIMTARLPDDGNLAPIDAFLEHKRAVVIGPGLGTDPHAEAVVRHVLSTFEGPVVVDADALTMHAGHPEAFASASGKLILTPHAGELARLLGVTSEAVEHDRFTAVRNAAVRSASVVLLKGPHTLVASPGGRITVNDTGNPALATAGSGDVLSGLCAALACSLSPFDAALCGAALHGAAGDTWKEKNGDRGLLAHEIADALPAVIAGLVFDKS